MSGLSLAVGKRPAAGEVAGDGEKSGANGGAFGGLMGSLRTIELQLMAFIVVFSASGLVPLLDILFPIVITAYLFLLDRFIFPHRAGDASGREVFHGSRNFQLYLALGTVVGLFFPLAYVLGGFARGDQLAVKAATPHLFLLSVQVLSENIISSVGVFSPPVRALVAMIYTSRRLFSLSDWVHAVFFELTIPAEPRLKDVAWAWFGKVLAMANLVYFSINMFGFLIPRFLPRAFERYIEAKAARVNNSGGAADKHEGKQKVEPEVKEEKKSK